jgi:hypothetical protein
LDPKLLVFTQGKKAKLAKHTGLSQKFFALSSFSSLQKKHPTLKTHEQQHPTETHAAANKH